MKLTLGFSPCPNDTFIFDALVNKKIDTGGLEFDVVTEDVETLNQWALESKLDITKLSLPAFFETLNKYILLTAGSALGKGTGPLLITKTEVGSSTSETRGMHEKVLNLKDTISNAIVVLPGEYTTAHLLFSLAFPEVKKKIFMRFDTIEDFILQSSDSPSEKEQEERYFGVIIHESRFTYQLKGLLKLIDLGDYWEEVTHAPIPLGSIAVKRSLEKPLSMQINKLVRKSLEYAFKNYPDIPPYVKNHSQEMDEGVMRKHIELYVNNYSIDLGHDGKNAVQTLYNTFLSARNGKKDIHSSDEMFLL